MYKLNVSAIITDFFRIEEWVSEVRGFQFCSFFSLILLFVYTYLRAQYLCVTLPITLYKSGFGKFTEN